MCMKKSSTFSSPLKILYWLIHDHAVFLYGYCTKQIYCIFKAYFSSIRIKGKLSSFVLFIVLVLHQNFKVCCCHHGQASIRTNWKSSYWLISIWTQLLSMTSFWLKRNITKLSIWTHFPRKLAIWTKIAR